MYEPRVLVGELEAFDDLGKVLGLDGAADSGRGDTKLGCERRGEVAVAVEATSSATWDNELAPAAMSVIAVE